MARIAEGRYEGSFPSSGTAIVIRVGRHDDGRLENLSGDLFAGSQHLLSFAGHPGGLSEGTDDRLTGTVSFFSGQPLPRSGSSIVLAPPDADTAEPMGSARVSLDLGAGVVTAPVKRVGAELRTLRIEIDGLAGLPEPDASLLDGDPGRQDLVAALRRASVAATVRTSPFRPDASGRRRHTMAELHALMQDWASPVRQGDGAWRLHVLFADRFDGRNSDDVTGIMYDVEPGLRPPRQGLAVFLNSSTIKRSAPVNGPDWRREVLFTLVHEIGHALNLPHAFEDHRAEALTWMNYPDNVAIGASAFWQNFQGSFDPPELSFLRHAPFCDIAPGQYDYAKRDSSFLTGGGFPGLLRAPEHDASSARSSPVKATLEIEPLKRVYAFGEPVFFKVTVTNLGRKPLAVTKALDPSDGFLSVQIRSPLGKLRRLRPPAALCQRAPRVMLGYKKTLSFDGILASFDADGAIFDEPGRHQVDATFSGIADVHLKSSPAYVRVLHPCRAEELLAISIWDDPRLMRAIYCRQPLLALDSWSRLVEETAQSIASDPHNTTSSYLHYIAAMGWLSSFSPASRKKKFKPRPKKAAAHLRLLQPFGLPSGVKRKHGQLLGTNLGDRGPANGQE